MRRLSVPLALGVLFSLGCLFGKKDDTDTSDPDGDGIAQSDVCSDYLACAAAVAPDSFAGLSATYGPSGDCWSQGQEFADNCTTACQASVEELALAHPVDDACSAYAPPFVLLDGDWTVTLQLGSVDSCGLSEYTGGDDEVLDGPVENDLENGTFTWHLSDGRGLSFDLACTDEGSDFSCSSEGDFILDVDGAGDKDNADGTWDISFGGTDGSCESSGDFTAELN
jgi:hypothetical protein